MKKRLTLVVLLVILLAEIAGAVFLLRREQTAPPYILASSRLNPIQQENQLPGITTWQVTNPAPYDPLTFRSPAIEGFAWTTSATAGERLSFSVSTTAPSFTADIYRLGWYQGKGGRLLQSITRLQGHFYVMPSTDPQTGLIEANWPVAFTVKVDPGWPSGIFIAKLTAATGEQSAIPFVIRSNRVSDFAFIHADSTDEAYNSWGGKSLYDFNSTEGHHAYKVSFDRPFLYNGGFQYLLNWEYPMIRWLESGGYDVSYLSTTDVENYPSLLQNHHGLLIVGHNEYWSKRMRENLEEAINKGVNLANFAADTMTWQVRYESSPSQENLPPNRIIVCYKDAIADPFMKQDTSQITVQFRQLPVNKPEQSLLGAMWAGDFNWGTSYDWIVADAANWIFAASGLKNGDHLPGLVGYEYDKVYPNFPVPQGDSILSSSPVHNIINNGFDMSNATVYTAQSGARVFDAGTIQWSWGLDGYGGHNVVNASAQKITKNILLNFLTVPSRPQP
jgi:hypothetical protein